jgi:putative membrane protein (TIGR04086 family)
MREVRGTPSIGWSAAIVGGLIAIVVGLVAGVGVASLAAALAGGFVAARLAGHHGALQGGAAAAVFIVGLALVETVSPATQLPLDTVLLIALDALHLAAGAAGGWLALRS